MIYRVKYFSITFIFFFLSVTTYSQNDGSGNTGLSFLKIGVTSRAISLGEAVVSYNEDASAVHYNPASLLLGSGVNILFMHNEQILGIRTEYLAGKIIRGDWALGLDLNNTSVKDIEIREIPGEPIDKFTAQNFALSFAAAYRINEEISIGATTKFLYEKIFIDNASGYAFDIGGLYHKELLSIGVSLNNIGSMSKLRSESSKLPISLRIGGSYMLFLIPINSAIRFSADGFKILDGGKIHINTGLEFLYLDFLRLRIGYQTGFENKSFTTGIGLRYKTFSLDYAFVPYKYSLGSSHTITLGTSF